MRRCATALLVLVPFLAAAALSQTQPPPADTAEERFLHTPPAAAGPGKPAVAEGPETGTLHVVVEEAEEGLPTGCRVNVVGADGNFYEPANNPLAPWSLHRTGNRLGKGPFRYYGWFFYTNGTFTVRVPAGRVRIQVARGYEYRPVTVETRVAAGETRGFKVLLRRTAPMSVHGYLSGDTHIHLARTTEAEDERALDLIAAEDLLHGFILCMNDPRGYTGTMSRQIWPQTHGFGPSSICRRGAYTLVSGQEYRCNTYGHICLLGHRRLVQENATVDPNNWPVFGDVAQETRALGGYSFHAHGGYAREIYADAVQRLTDGVELLQFAEYRGIELQGWYRLLNVGYRFPAVGASDFPYCRALGDCRTYVRPTGPATAQEWVRAAAAGRSFMTTGPLLLFEVAGQPPGEVLHRSGPGPHRVAVRLRLRCEVAPVQQAELIVNGRTARRWTIPAEEQQGKWVELREEVEITEPSWLAARAYSTSVGGKPDAEAHTNPVHIYLNGKTPYQERDAAWLVERLDELIATQERRSFAEKEKVVAFYRRARDELLKLRGKH